MEAFGAVFKASLSLLGVWLSTGRIFSFFVVSMDGTVASDFSVGKTVPVGRVVGSLFVVSPNLKFIPVTIVDADCLLITLFCVSLTSFSLLVSFSSSESGSSNASEIIALTRFLPCSLS